MHFADRKSVLIIGEGLAGLSSAIVASKAGFDVTIIKKRPDYIREQRLFLNEESMTFLKEINVFNNLNVKPFEMENKNRCIIQVNILEKALYQEVQKFGIKILRGEFQGFENESAIIKTSENGIQKINYELLIGADGAHSSVRNALKIKTNIIGTKAIGAMTFIPDLNSNTEPKIDEKSKENIFIRNISTPMGCFVLLQNKGDDEAKVANKQTIMDTLTSCEWTQEAEAMKNQPSHTFENINVVLQQSASFCDEEKNALLSGDAIAVGSFYLGRGANLAILSVKIIEKFLKMKNENKYEAFKWYNNEIKNISDILIDSNKHLFV